MFLDQKHLLWGKTNNGRQDSPPWSLMYLNVFNFFHFFVDVILQVQTWGTCGGLFSQIFLQPSFSTKLMEKIFFVENSTKVTRKMLFPSGFRESSSSGIRDEQQLTSYQLEGLCCLCSTIVHNYIICAAHLRYSESPVYQ